MLGITIFGLIVVLIVIAIIAAIGSFRMARRSSPSDIRADTERELGVRETTVGDEESPLNRPKTGA
jgi:type II secretory pathway pseudopilin PulG